MSEQLIAGLVVGCVMGWGMVFFAVWATIEIKTKGGRSDTL